MSDTGPYFLIAYMWLRPPMPAWVYANAVIREDPADWLLGLTTDREEEYVLLWAREITAEQYEALKGQLN